MFMALGLTLGKHCFMKGLEIQNKCSLVTTVAFLLVD